MLVLRDDDDINDVASMAGVNLNEENARILATSSELVGTKIRSCKDESFLPAGLLHRRILDTGTATNQPVKQEALLLLLMVVLIFAFPFLPLLLSFAGI